jgi:hypothetical protein
MAVCLHQRMFTSENVTQDGARQCILCLGFCAGRSVYNWSVWKRSKGVREIDKKHKCDVANVGLAAILHADVQVRCTKNLITQKPDKATGSLA